MTSAGSIIKIQNGKLDVPNDPIIPYIEGDGIGPDIWKSAVRVLDAAVEKAYKGDKKITWLEVYAGEKAFKKFMEKYGEKDIVNDIIFHPVSNINEVLDLVFV